MYKLIGKYLNEIYINDDLRELMISVSSLTAGHDIDDKKYEEGILYLYKLSQFCCGNGWVYSVEGIEQLRDKKYLIIDVEYVDVDSDWHDHYRHVKIKTVGGDILFEFRSETETGMYSADIEATDSVDFKSMRIITHDFHGEYNEMDQS